MTVQSRQTNIAKSGEKDKIKFQSHLSKPYIRSSYKGTGKLKNKVAVIAGQMIYINGRDIING